MGKNCNCGKNKKNRNVTFSNTRNENGGYRKGGNGKTGRMSRIEMLKMLWEKSKTENPEKEEETENPEKEEETENPEK